MMKMIQLQKISNKCFVFIREQKLCRKRFLNDRNVRIKKTFYLSNKFMGSFLSCSVQLERYKHYSIGLVNGQDRFHDIPRPLVQKKLKEKTTVSGKKPLKLSLQCKSLQLNFKWIFLKEKSKGRKEKLKWKQKKKVPEQVIFVHTSISPFPETSGHSLKWRLF